MINTITILLAMFALLYTMSMIINERKQRKARIKEMEYITNHLDHTDKRIKKIAISKGYDSQSIKLIEEMAELQQAICKHRESKDKAKSLIDIKGEIADVYIMLEQVKYILNISDEELYKIKEYKINRQLLRMKSE